MNDYEIYDGLADLDSLRCNSTLPNVREKYLEEQCIEKDKLIEKLEVIIKKLTTAIEDDFKTKFSEYCAKEREKIQFEKELEIYKKNDGQPVMINSIVSNYNTICRILKASNIDIEAVLCKPNTRLRLVETGSGELDNVCNSCNSNKHRKNKGNTKEQYRTADMVELRNKGYSVKQIAKMIGCSERLVYIRCNKNT